MKAPATPPAPPEIRDYEFHDLLGEGSFGWVWRAVWRGSQERAVKVFKKNRVDIGTVDRELKKLQLVREHSGIVALYDFDLVDDVPYYAMSLHARKQDGKWEGRTLEKLCGKVDAEEAVRLLRQVADALAYLHDHRVIHCDVKPSNVLLTDEKPSHVKLCDFGQSRGSASVQLEISGTPFYAPPEQLRHPGESGPDEQGRVRGYRWDVYSFGVLAYKLATGKLPRLEDLAEAYRKAESGDRSLLPASLTLHDHIPADHLAAITEAVGEAIEWPADCTLGAEERRIIEQCLHLDPLQRWSDMEEVKKAFTDLEHERKLAAERHLTALAQEAADQARLVAEHAQEAERQARSRATLFRRAAMLVSLLAVAAASVGIYAWTQKQKASSRERTATAMLFLLKADELQKAGAADAALAHAKAAVLAESNPGTRSALLRNLLRTPFHLQSHDAGGDGVSALAWSRDGSVLVVGVRTGAVHSVDRDGTMRLLAEGRGQKDQLDGVLDLAFAEDGSVTVLHESGVVRRHALQGLPHHLVAVDLIARGFRLAAAGDYERVIVLFPDHFRQMKHTCATTPRGFRTVYGRVAADTQAVETLLSSGCGIVESDLFESDHGVHAVLPFIAHFFPRARLVPVALNISPPREGWDGLVQALAPLAGGRTLIVQSTDFSHFLVRNLARERDQQTLHALATGKVEALAGLKQPAHLDSKAAQHVHMAVQQAVHGAAPEVVENRNSYEYLGWEGSPTTSYVVQVFRRPSATKRPIPAWPGQQVWFFAGDTNFGRYLDAPLRDEAVAARLRESILAMTGGAPMVVNLEGVMLDAPLPRKLPPLRIAMESGQTLRWLKSLNVAGVSLANNHARDFGVEALAAMKRRLSEAGIVALEHGESHNFGALRLLALKDVDNHGEQRRNLVSGADLLAARELRLPQPAFAFIHWGQEYESTPGRQELSLVDRLMEHGFPLVIGAHPHVASTRVVSSAGNRAACVHSLGNFLFDQGDRRTSGCLVEARIFAQGTCFLRLIPLGNLYREHVLSAEPAGPASKAAPVAGGLPPAGRSY